MSELSTPSVLWWSDPAPWQGTPRSHGEPAYVIMYAYVHSIICLGEVMVPPPSPTHFSVIVCTACSSVLQVKCAALRESYVSLGLWVQASFCFERAHARVTVCTEGCVTVRNALCFIAGVQAHCRIRLKGNPIGFPKGYQAPCPHHVHIHHLTNGDWPVAPQP